MSDLALGNLKLSSTTGWRSLQAYAETSRDTLRYYDFAGGDEPTGAHDGISLAAFGRLTFFEAGLRTSDAAALMRAADGAVWSLVPESARLVDADPDERGGLYDAAEDFYRSFLNVSPRVHAADVSKLLRLNRPDLFPVLDAPVRVIYGDRAAAAWEALDRPERPRSGKSFWPVIREDVLAAEQSIATWRADLQGSPDALLRSMASLSDLRLWDIVVRSLGPAVR